MRTVPRVLITGCDGFTGRYLVEEFEKEGYSVAGISRRVSFGYAGAGKGVGLENLKDMQRAVEVIQPDIVVHLAAISFVPHGNVDEIYTTNVIGTRNLLEAISSVGIQPSSVVIPSSAAVYGGNDGGPIGEDAPICPLNDYAVSKVAMEYIARIWMDKLPITLVRPFNYIGIGQSANFVVPKIVSHYRESESQIELGNLDVYRDFSDVRDIVRAYVEISRGKCAGRTYNLCSGKAYSLRDVLQIMKEISGAAIKVNVNQRFVRKNDASRLVGSQEKLRNELGVGMDTPLRDTLRWMYTSSACHASQVDNYQEGKII